MGRGDGSNSGLGQRLKQARVEAGLTQREAGQAIGVDPNTIYSYETDRVNPSGPALRSLAHAYDKPYEWFFGEEKEPEPEATPEDPEEDDIDIMDPSLRLFFRGEWDEFTEAEREFVKGMIRQSRDLLRKRREASG